MASWDIVFFLKDNTSEYVPTSWAINKNKDMYLWPKKLSETQIKKLREGCSKPSINIEYEEWAGICKATVYKLEDAQNLADKAQYTSNLSSASEQHVDDLMESEEEDKSDDCLDTIRNKSKKKPLNRTANVPNTDDSFRTPTGSRDSDKDLLKKITKALAGIKYELREIKTDISNININLNMLKNEHRPRSLTLCSDFKLPLTTSEELQELEKKIENATQLQDLVNVLSHVGGDTIKKNVHFIMKKLMDRKLSLTYSAKGKKQKKDFSNLGLYKAVLEAVNLNFTDATELNITRCIGISLATAGDRDGGRQIRAKETSQQDV